MRPIYLDHNATTPVAPEVAEAMAPYLYGEFGNPSSAHPYGIAAKRAVETARGHVARLIGCDSGEIVFTSGGTESNNAAIKGVALALRDRGNHIVTSSIEHPAVTEVCRWLEGRGFEVTWLGVDGHGLVAAADLEAALRDSTILVSIMHANNEVGTIQPITDLARAAHARGAVFHTDAAQSVGKLPVDVDALGVDLLSIAGHKLYAPKGVGALYIRIGTELAPLLHGADHEAGRRPGTENVLEIVGLGKACEIARRDLAEDDAHFRGMRDRLHEEIVSGLGDDATRLNGHPELRLPNTLSLSFRGVEANTLLSEVGDRVAASAGAACHTDRIDVSHVLEAMSVPEEWAMGTVRFSVGRSTTEGEIDSAVGVIVDAVRRLMPGASVLIPGTGEAGDYRLTRYTRGLGCACKLRPQVLERVLASMPVRPDADVIVGRDTVDDAAVYRLTDELAIVQTVDFFTPVVDDAYDFGAVSAANSLSDVYAMGARPLFALSIVGFPDGRLPVSVLEAILRGASDKAAEAGISIVGGHTVEDTEPKFGLAVTGIVSPDRVMMNSGANVGDALVLTKPIGLGIIATAVKSGLAEESVAREATAVMSALNRGAAEAMLEVGANACTDVTGFGLLGHLREMAAASGVDVALSAAAVPVMRTALDLAAADVVPGGTLNNLAHVEEHVAFDRRIPRAQRLLLADAQTSGGLLIALPAPRADDLLGALDRRGIDGAAKIGEATKEGRGHIEVKP